MNREDEEKLLELLQPPGYISKIKLYCNYCIFEIRKIKD